MHEKSMRLRGCWVAQDKNTHERRRRKCLKDKLIGLSIWQEILALACSITALGFLGCAGSFVVLVSNSFRTDISSMIALALLVGGTLVAEHTVLKRRRPKELSLLEPSDL